MKNLFMLILPIFLFSCKPNLQEINYVIPEMPVNEKASPAFLKGDILNKNVIIRSDPIWKEQELVIEGIDSKKDTKFSIVADDIILNNLHRAINIFIERYCEEGCKVHLKWADGYWAYEVSMFNGETWTLILQSESQLLAPKPFSDFSDRVKQLKYTPNFYDSLPHTEDSTLSRYFYKENRDVYYIGGSKINGSPIWQKVVNAFKLQRKGSQYLVIKTVDGFHQLIRNSFSEQEIELIELFSKELL